MSDRIQYYCPQCGKYTLHALDAQPVNHVLHLLITLFACGCWWPIWLLLALTAPRREYHCGICGQVPGEDAPRLIVARERIAAIEQEQRLIETTAKRRENAKARGEAIEATAEAASALASKTADVAGMSVTAVVNAARLMLRQIDTGLQRMVGDDPGGLWLARFLLVASCAVTAGIAIFAAWKILS